MCCEERYTQRRTASSSCIFRRALRARRSRVTFLSVICYALLLLGFFTADDFVCVTNTFALIRFRTTEVTNLRSDLTNQLLVDTLDQDLGLVRGFSNHTFRQLIVDRMGEAESEVQHLTFGLRLVTNADQLQLALEAGANADHHVVDQGTGSAGHGASLLVAIAGSETQLTGFMQDFNGRVNIQFESALGTLYRQLLTGEIDLNTSGQRNGVLSNARHAYSPLRTLCKALRRRHRQRAQRGPSSHPCWWRRWKPRDRHELSADHQRICTGEGLDGSRASLLR